MTMADMAADLLRLEGEKIDVVPDNEVDGKNYRVLSDRHLEMLLDRSPEVFQERGQGWSSTEADGSLSGHDGEDEGKMSGGGSRRKAAFAVYEAPKDQGHDANDALVAMIGESFAA
jgi:ATP-dependent DNA helicase